MKTAKQRIEEIKNHGYNLDFSAAFNHAFETYKKIALLGGVSVLIFSIIAIAVVLGIMAVTFGFASLSESMTDFKITDLSIGFIAVYVLGMAVLGGLAAPFTAGLIKMAHNAATGQPFSIGTVFEYYNGRYFGDLFLTMFLISILSGGINVLIEIALGVPLVGGFIGIVISIFTFLAIPLIIFGNLKPVDAISGSVVVVSKNFFMIVLLTLVGYVMACIGFIAFCIGLFFTVPFMYAMYYSIYVHSVGVDDTAEINEIGSELN